MKGGNTEKLADSGTRHLLRTELDTAEVGQEAGEEETVDDGHPDGVDVPFHHDFRHTEHALRTALDELHLIVRGK